MNRPKRNPQKQGRRSTKKVLLISLIILIGVMLIRLLTHVMLLNSAATQPVDLFLVLGGSIKREIYVSKLAQEYPNTRILISTGSDDPCVVKLFERNQAPMQQVWLEKCADSTFGNFVFSQPILSQWRVHHVKLITSATHLPRAKWMAQLILGAHGIWVEPELVEETGIPGNQESAIKTGLDVIRAVVWAFVSQVVQIPCFDVVPLPEVNLKQWCQDGFQCERQANIDPKSICQPFE